jgi:dGTPase
MVHRDLYFKGRKDVTELEKIMDGVDLRSIRIQLEKRETLILSEYGTLSITGVRRFPEKQQGHRTSFAVDADRILHSKAYTRYIDKTQVFYLVENDHITHRVLHVQLVSKIARTIGRVFGLNEDLLEAIALGHDLGHPPFGHDGEQHLDRLAKKHGLASFQHNIQSIRFLEYLEERAGFHGCNLTVQVLDGILCHDGEAHNTGLFPQGDQSFAAFDLKVQEKYADPMLSLHPMTMEGCVVRLADTLSYIGRDIEDAILLGLIQREDLPADCVRVLGRSNGAIVHNLVTDLIANGCDGRIGFSSRVAEALLELKRFNYKAIYLNETLKPDRKEVADCFTVLFEKYMEDVCTERAGSVMMETLLQKAGQEYCQNTPPAVMVLDVISGMTDDYFLKEAAVLGCFITRKQGAA